MQERWYQKLFNSYVRWLLVGFIFAGSILDTASNAINLISQRVSIIGTAVTVLTTLALQLYLRYRPIQWITRDRQIVRLKSLGWRSIFPIVGLLFALWVPRFIGSPKNIEVVPPNTSSATSNPNSQELLQNKESNDDFLAIQPIWHYEKPPAPEIELDDEGKEMLVGFEYIVALRILNKTDKLILVDDFRFTWPILTPPSAYEDFDKTDLSLKEYIAPDSGQTASLKETLNSVDGGYVDGSARIPFFVYANANEIEEATSDNFLPQKASNQVYPPFKLEPYQEIFLHLRVELKIVMKNGQRFALNLKRQKEADEFYKLIPLFFGAKNPNDLYRRGQLVLKSSVGRLIYELNGPIIFAGATLYLPEEYANKKRK